MRQPITFVLGDRVAQTNGTTTTFALDVQGLPEVLYTSDGERYLHLPGLILTDDGSQTRHLLSDGLVPMAATRSMRRRRW
jgi:hypothetical protein